MFLHAAGVMVALAAATASTAPAEPLPARAAGAGPLAAFTDDGPVDLPDGQVPLDGGGARPLPQPPASADGAPSVETVALQDGGGARLPSIVFDAYRKAEASLAKSSPGCHLPWQLLAAIGEVESGQADGGRVDANGTTYRPILGPVLDGNGFAAIPDTDGGRYDGSAAWDRAVGPMQFIPSTWATWGADGNDDGKADPNNIWDAALAAGRYLCAGGRDLAVPAQLDRAVLGYNHSAEYLRTVRAWMAHFQAGVSVTPPAPAPTPTMTPSPSAPKPSPSADRSPSAGPSPAVSPSPTASGSPSPSPSASPSGTPSGCPSPTAGPTVSPSPSASASASSSPSPSPTTSASPSPSPSATPSGSPSPGCNAPSPTASTSSSPSPSARAGSVPSASPGAAPVK
ncbi:lytic transglycosylase domain-containing protein [Kitasatospora sp. NPDC004614]|uniref:lytic transglycosylase domain-containing protein n=1 Tax=unclassified Kitasatospora TaxID=2633591 RepID=UPI0036CF6646